IKRPESDRIPNSGLRSCLIICLTLLGQINSLFFEFIFSLKQAIRLVSFCSQKGFGMVSSRTMTLKQDQIILNGFFL
ncbi:hypothetical protein, partial [Peribacillus simplex]|uniref:hypothetical protein n=1 Tax=Peribacillus simplex TaxID=1478 RepID=UPI001C870D4D